MEKASPTLEQLAAEVARVHERLDEQDRQAAEAVKHVEDLLGERRRMGLPQEAWDFAREAVREHGPEVRRSHMRVIDGAAKRRTARRGKLRLVS